MVGGAHDEPKSVGATKRLPGSSGRACLKAHVRNLGLLPCVAVFTFLFPRTLALRLSRLNDDLLAS